MKGYVRTITDLPLMVVNTHAHLDHIGGDFQFDEVYITKTDEKYLEENSSKELRYQFEIISLDGSDTEFPYKLEDFTETREIKWKYLESQQIIDLGGRSLTCISIPGHTKGSAAFLDSRTGILFSGDCGNSRTFVFMDESTSVSEYRASLVKFKRDYGDKVKKWYQFHGKTEVPVSIIDELIECSDRIIGHREQGADFCFNLGKFAKIKAKSAMKIEANGSRVDGKTGNIMFDPSRR
ncbi:MAG: MBL fold metallo-hydrolase [Lachnospiraceae bacterium]|nr:MBL fold metallo-hydrolase [Lachnospiraceae bacterium]